MTEWIEIDGVKFRVPQEVANAMRGLFADKADLLAEVERLRKLLNAPDPLSQALNESDGVYRP